MLRQTKKKKNKIPKKRPIVTKKRSKNKKKSEIFFCAPKDLIIEEPAIEKKLISFGLLQHEIDEILTQQNLHKDNHELENILKKSLASLLPKSETVVRAKNLSPQQLNHHTLITIKNTEAHSEHSPYVLDLTALIEKKRSQKEKKAQIWNFVKQKEIVFVPKKSTEKKLLLPTPTEKTVFIKHKKIAKKTTNKNNFHRQFTGKPWHYHLNIPYFWPQKTLAYLLLGAMIILPIKVFGHYENLLNLKNNVQDNVISATTQLKTAGQNIADNNWQNVSENFVQAEEQIHQAKKQINSLNIGLRAILQVLPTDGANLQDAKKVLDLTENLAKIGSQLPNLIEIFSSEETLTAKITNIRNILQNIQPQLDNIYTDLHSLRDSAIPDEQKNDFQDIKNSFDILYFDLKEFQNLTVTLGQILGEQNLKRYLFLFQNTNELRATGGFVGSLALVDIDQGKIKNLEIPNGGSYDFQGQLAQNVISPHPLQVINAKWELQDANWFPDFKLSAQKIKSFYENAGGPTVDGVIAINSDIISEILKITGPIYLAKYNRSFDSNNVILELQKTIDSEKQTSDNKPKQILADLAPEIITRLFDAKSQNYLQLASLLKTSFNQKQLQVYFKNQAWQQKFADYGWTGEIKNPSQDYLMVVNSNIGGGKTDAYIKQKISLNSQLKNDGQILNTVTITRKHEGDPNDYFAKTSNLDFVRIYVPAGAKLINDSGFSTVPADKFENPTPSMQTDPDLQEISGEFLVKEDSGTIINQEMNKTVFGNWLQVDPGETATATFTYLLPYKIKLTENKLFRLAGFDNTQNYSIYLQKQSGQKNTDYEIKFSTEPQINLTALKGEQLDEQNIKIDNNDQTDFYLLASLKK